MCFTRFLQSVLRFERLKSHILSVEKDTLNLVTDQQRLDQILYLKSQEHRRTMLIGLNFYSKDRKRLGLSTDMKQSGKRKEYQRFKWEPNSIFVR